MTPMFLTLDGEPRTGVVPVQLIINGVATPGQLAEVRAWYAKFDTKCRTSLASSQILVRTLLDGSAVRFERRFDVDRVILDPIGTKGDGRLKSPVAWSAFVDLAFSTVFDRPVIDMGSYTAPPYPTEPIYPTPAPYGVPEPTFVPTPVTDSIGWMWWSYTNFVRLDDAGNKIWGGMRLLHSTSLTDSELAALGSLAFDISGVYANGNKIPSPQQGGENEPYKWTISGDSYGTFLYNGTGMTVQQVKDVALAAIQAQADAQAAASANDNARYIEYLAAVQAWANARNAYYANLYNAWWTTVHQAWVDECKAIDDAYPSRDGATILKDLRTQARSNQIAALKDWLDTGIGNPHLTARYLSFPFNVGGAHAGNFSLPAGTDVGHDQITDATVNYQITHTVTNGNVGTVATETYADNFAQMTMALPSGWKLGGNVAKPTNLFGWLANGDYKRYKRYHPNHYLEPSQTTPSDLSSLSFSTAPGYVDFVNSQIGATTRNDAVINSDGFIPPGSVITLAQLEYEVYDPYVLDWVWMPAVDLRKYDSIWIASLGQYSIPELPGLQSAGVSPRNVRVRRFLRQTRLDSWAWSSPTDVPAEKMQKGSLPTFPLSSIWPYYPTTVVVAMSLHAGAKPNVEQVTSFQYSPEIAFKGMSRDLAGAISGDWASEGSLFTLVAKTMNHIYKVT